MLPPQIDMAKQLGLRSIMEDTFHTVWWVPDDMPPDVLMKYLKALNRAAKAIQDDLPKYLPLWKMSVPAEFQNKNWDYAKFTRGERFVYEPIPKVEFNEVLRQVERWGLDQHLTERGFENLIPSAAA